MGFLQQSARTGQFLVALAFLAPNAYAADTAEASPKVAAPSLFDVLEASGIVATGYLDASYGSSTISGANELAASHNDDGATFALNQASLTVAKQPKEGFGALVNLTAGQAMPILNTAEGSSPSTFNVTQAFIQYASGRMTVIAGKFVTLAGAEVIASPSDYTFSRSILFGYAIPYTHTGARLSYAVSDSLSFTLGANNGWNGQAYRHVTAEMGATFTPIKSVTLIIDGYIGNEPSTASTGNSQRQLFDAVLTWAPTDTLSFILNYDWAKQKGGTAIGSDARWEGLAGYALFTINDNWKVTLRGEYFNDKDAFATGTVQKWKEGTASISFLATKAAEFRFELRDDKSDKPFFTESNSGDVKSSQFSYGIQALYKF
jgi:Putative beta-barrel porin-2, OmpL-like. bbp2